MDVDQILTFKVFPSDIVRSRSLRPSEVVILTLIRLADTRWTIIEKSLPNAFIELNDMSSHDEGRDGVSSKLRSPVGRIPKRPSVNMRAYRALSVERWRWLPSGQASTGYGT